MNILTRMRRSQTAEDGDVPANALMNDGSPVENDGSYVENN